MVEEKQEEQEEKPRLYSSGPKDRIPVDGVDQDQQKVHALLIRWGRWNSTGRPSSGLASIEGLYTKAGTPPATAPLGADPLLMAVERAVIRMPKAHRDTVRWLYVYRLTPYSICRTVKPRLRYEAWPAWARVCRCMVENLMRRHG